VVVVLWLQVDCSSSSSRWSIVSSSSHNRGGGRGGGGDQCVMFGWITIPQCPLRHLWASQLPEQSYYWRSSCQPGRLWVWSIENNIRHVIVIPFVW
jgi:hypothetical protein